MTLKKFYWICWGDRLIKLYSFQVYNSILHYLYIILCGHHPKSSLLQSPFILFYLLLIPLPSGKYHTVVCVYEGFFFLWLILSLSSLRPQSSFTLTISMSLFLFCLLGFFVHWIPDISEIIQYLFFSGRLISLSIILSRSTHVVAKRFPSFYGWVVFHCENVPQLFIHSPMDKHLGFFQILVAVNNAAMNTGVHMRSVWE